MVAVTVDTISNKEAAPPGMVSPVSGPELGVPEIEKFE